jgi:purine catabolism regulator
LLRLFELIRDTPFGLECVTRNTSTNRRVAGGHVVEMPDPGRWLATDYLALTTGVALKGDTTRQHDFVASVHECGSAALGFGVGVNFRNVPPAMIAAGEELGLPIVSVPLEVPFREVLDFISRSALEIGFQDYSRALRLQDYLLAALSEADAEAALAKRISELLIGGVAIFSADGRLVAAAGRAPLEEMWSAIQGGMEVVKVDQKRVVSAEACLGRDPRYYIAACVRDDDRSEAYGDEVLQFASRVAQAIAAASQIAVSQERAARDGLLSRLLASPQLPPDLVAQLRAFSLDAHGRTSLLVARVPPDAEVLPIVAHACEIDLRRCQVPYLSSVGSGRVVAVWQDAPGGASVVAALNETARKRGVAVGLSRPAEDMSSLAQALTEAGVALLEAERLPEPSVVGYEDLALSDLVLTRRAPELTARARSILDPLQRERPEMLETLVQYLEHDCDVISCAKHLYVHPNTLRYRLSRIEIILGRSLRSVSTLTDLYLALRLHVADSGEKERGADSA